MSDYEIFPLGDCALQAGGVLPNGRLAYVVHGTLNAARDNAIVFPTHYGGTHTDNEWLIGKGKVLDTDRYCIIVPNMLGNGVSSSPATRQRPMAGRPSPRLPSTIMCSFSIDW